MTSNDERPSIDPTGFLDSTPVLSADISVEHREIMYALFRNITVAEHAHRLADHFMKYHIAMKTTFTTWDPTVRGRIPPNSLFQHVVNFVANSGYLIELDFERACRELSTPRT